MSGSSEKGPHQDESICLGGGFLLGDIGILQFS